MRRTPCNRKCCTSLVPRHMVTLARVERPACVFDQPWREGKGREGGSSRRRTRRNRCVVCQPLTTRPLGVGGCIPQTITLKIFRFYGGSHKICPFLEGSISSLNPSIYLGFGLFSCFMIRKNRKVRLVVLGVALAKSGFFFFFSKPQAKISK